MERTELRAKAFQNAKDQIGFCGIWCGSCPGGNGVTIELTKKYEEFIKNREGALRKWPPKIFDFKEFMKGLVAIRTMPSFPGCSKGGGDPTCKVRICALKKDIVNCSGCDQLSTCTRFETLKKSYP